jgi:hypothetical protein
MESKTIGMDLAVKKIELINWLTRQDEAMIKKIDMLRQSSVESSYFARMGEDIDAKLARSEADIKAGRTHGHHEVVSYFKSKFGK